MIMKYGKMLASHRKKMKSWRFLANVFFLGLLSGDDKVIMKGKKIEA